MCFSFNTPAQPINTFQNRPSRPFFNFSERNPREHTRNRVATPQRFLALGHTPIKLEPLAQYLENYKNKKDALYLLDDFTKGFQLQYSGPRISIFSKSLVSAE